MLAWFVLHPRLKTLMQLLFAVIAVLGLVLAFYFHGQDNSKFRAQRVAEQARQDASKASAVAIRKALCPLIYTYEHLNTTTPNATQVANGWRGVGVLIGCPNGSKG